MRERLIPRNRPDDDTLGASAGTPEANELPDNVERNLRDQIELRLRFANAVSRVRNISFIDALKGYTDVHVRVTGEFPGDSEAANPKWEEFARLISSDSTQEQIDEHLVSAYKERISDVVDHAKDLYWPFRSDPPRDGVVKLHFGSMAMTPDPPVGEPGILSKERLEEQRAKLKAMFTEIKQKYPNAKEVRGSSWLYNREAYRRLYPDSFTASHTIRKGSYQGGGTWGQFRKKDGSVDPEAKKLFIQNLSTLDPEDVGAAFPLKTWVVRGPIGEFYKEYGIE